MPPTRDISCLSLGVSLWHKDWLRGSWPALCWYIPGCFVWRTERSVSSDFWWLTGGPVSSPLQEQRSPAHSWLELLIFNTEHQTVRANIIECWSRLRGNIYLKHPTVWTKKCFISPDGRETRDVPLRGAGTLWGDDILGTIRSALFGDLSPPHSGDQRRPKFPTRGISCFSLCLYGSNVMIPW